jgi:DNA modification methylase
MQYTIKQGMNQDILKSYPDNHFDSIVTDPPYGIEFLGKDWDSNTGAIETWEECFRVLKPGGHILAFSAARTYHNLATNIESVGFEIRDQLMWIYASGFPKAQDIGKAIDKREIKNNWHGWKTALKPAHEPIVMARKPFKGSCIDNVLKHSTGALNIDATRIEYETDAHVLKYDGYKNGSYESTHKNPTSYSHGSTVSIDEKGRFPSNVFGEIPDYQKYFYCPKVSRAERHTGFESVPQPEPFNNPDEMKKHPLWDPSIGTNSHRLMTKIREHNKGSLDHIATGNNFGDGLATGVDIMTKAKGYTQDGTLGRMKDAYAKGSLDHIPAPFGDVKGAYVDGERMAKVADDTQYASMGNNHPTVKPVALMSYLVKLVTPEGGKVLDPFSGSGSTGMAAVEHGFDYTGCELDPAYVEIATKRIEGWYNKTLPDNNFNELFDGEKQ